MVEQNKDTNKEALSAFMKKQISEKSHKKITHHAHEASNNLNGANDKNQMQMEEELSEDEELQEVKKASESKAAEYDQSEMIKKLILENLFKYTAIVIILAIAAIAIIKFGVIILSFLNGLIYRLMMMAFEG